MPEVYIFVWEYDYEGFSAPQGVWVGEFPSKEKLDKLLTDYFTSDDAALTDSQYDQLVRLGDTPSNMHQPGDDLHIFGITAND